MSEKTGASEAASTEHVAEAIREAAAIDKLAEITARKHELKGILVEAERHVAAVTAEPHAPEHPLPVAPPAPSLQPALLLPLAAAASSPSLPSALAACCEVADNGPKDSDDTAAVLSAEFTSLLHRDGARPPAGTDGSSALRRSRPPSARSPLGELPSDAQSKAPMTEGNALEITMKPPPQAKGAERRRAPCCADEVADIKKNCSLVSARLRCVDVLQANPPDPVELTLALQQSREHALAQEECGQALLLHTHRLRMQAEDTVNHRQSTLAEVEQAAELLEAVQQAPGVTSRDALSRASHRMQREQADKQLIGLRCFVGPSVRLISLRRDAPFSEVLEEVARKLGRQPGGLRLSWQQLSPLGPPSAFPLSTEDEWRNCVRLHPREVVEVIVPPSAPAATAAPLPVPTAPSTSPPPLHGLPGRHRSSSLPGNLPMQPSRTLPSGGLAAASAAPSTRTFAGGELARRASKDRVVRCFRRCDSDGDGFVTPEDIARVLAKLEGNRWSDRRCVESVMRAADRNRDGRLTCEEFIAWAQASGDPLDDLRRAMLFELAPVPQRQKHQFSLQQQQLMKERPLVRAGSPPQFVRAGSPPQFSSRLLSRSSSPQQLEAPTLVLHGRAARRGSLPRIGVSVVGNVTQGNS